MEYYRSDKEKETIAKRLKKSVSLKLAKNALNPTRLEIEKPGFDSHKGQIKKMKTRRKKKQNMYEELVKNAGLIPRSVVIINKKV